MTAHIKRTARNQGRVQFMAARKMIKELLEAGYDYKSIHAVLTDHGQMTICYSAFCAYLTKADQGNLEKPPVRTADLKAGRRPVKGGGPDGGNLFKSDKYEPFSLDRTKSLNDLA